jgi:hypothetical protein
MAFLSSSSITISKLGTLMLNYKSTVVDLVIDPTYSFPVSLTPT